MTKPAYYELSEMIEMIDEPNRSACRRLYGENQKLFWDSRGSTHNHQAWPGGYHDHVQDAMNYAILFYRADESTGRPMPYLMSDALLCLFLHDLEKPWRFDRAEDGSWRNSGLMTTKQDRAAFRWKKIEEYGFTLTPAQINGVTYAEGEGDDYRSDRRVSNELAAMVHMCDSYSARARYDYPRVDDPWAGR